MRGCGGRRADNGRRGADEGGDERGAFATEGGAFGLKKGADEERVGGHGKLGGANFVLVIEGGEVESGALEGGAVFRGRAVIAAIAFRRGVRP